MTTGPDLRLRDLAKRYGMTYRIQPEWGADPSWSQQRIGFELALHSPDHPDAPAAMREVAKWALPDSTEVCVTMDEQKGHVQQTKGHDGWTVELTAHILHCGDVRRPVDGGEQQFVEEVKRRLASLGIAER